jgi:hypothetical protein
MSPMSPTSSLPGCNRLGLFMLLGSAAACQNTEVFFHCAGNIGFASATSDAWSQRMVAEGQAAGNPLAAGVRPARGAATNLT